MAGREQERAASTSSEATAARPAERLLTIQRDLGLALSGLSGLREALAVVLDAVLRIEGFDCGGIYVRDPATGALELQATRGLSDAFLAQSRHYASDSGGARLVHRGEPVFLGYDELITNVVRGAHTDASRAEGLRVIAVVPILHQGSVLGCINASSHREASIPEVARQALVAIAASVGMAMARVRAEEALRASEERLRVVYEHARDGILVADVRDRRCREGNRAICAMLGYTLDEILALRIDDIHPPEAFGSVRDHFERQAAGSSSVAPDIPVVRKDGTVFYADINSAPITLHGVPCLLGVFRDVTELRRMQAEVAKAQRLEAVGLLAGGIAHDFNNILTAVTGNISLAKERAPSQSPLGSLLDAAERATTRARDLTQQLLTFGRGGTPIRRPARLAELVREAADFVLRGSAVKARFDLPAELWDADIDPGQIGRVVQNLVLNAAQSMGEGGRVDICARNAVLDADTAPGRRPGRYVRCSVADHGCGIAPKDLPHIFDPYFTTKQTGSGLGLAVTYSVVTKHGGSIDVDSRPGRGTTIHVVLPASSVPATTELSTAAQVELGGGKVLLMDDDVAVRKVTSRMLESLGFEVAGAAHGDDALRMHREARERGEPFDLVLLDLTVPGAMGGVACAAALREADPSVRIVVASGYSDDPVMSAPERYGMCATLAKPFGVQELRAVLSGLTRGGS
jgi:PAS domain S-box-containing protein